MPKPAKIVGILIKIPPNQARGGWDIDAERLAAFCKHFGIKQWNLTIRWTSGIQTTGSHGMQKRNGNWNHSISMSQNLSFEDAQNTFLHELCHAIQNEKYDDPMKFDKAYRRYNHSGRYYQEDNPFEIEANDFARDNLSEWGDVLYS